MNFHLRIAALLVSFFLFQSAIAREEEPASLEDISTEVQNAESVNQDTSVSDTSLKISEDAEDGVIDETKTETFKSKKVCDCKWLPDAPYRVRRGTWGGYVGVGIGTFAPINYQPDFRRNANFSDYYGNKSPNAEVNVGAKLNFVLGSLGANLSGAFFSAQNSADNSTLSVQMVSLGGIFALDTIFKEPYLVPYAMAGAYTSLYSESVGGLKVSGNTAIAPFYAVGGLIQLDWIDPETHQTGYTDYGIENTFLYVEARSYLATASTTPDLSTPLQFSGGLKVEF